MTVARVFVALLVACCYPLSINPGRKVILAILAHLDPEDIEITDRVLLIRFAVVTVSSLRYQHSTPFMKAPVYVSLMVDYILRRDSGRCIVGKRH